MIFCRKTLIPAVLAIALMSCSPLYAAGQGSLHADTIHYNANNKEFKAQGNVTLLRWNSKINGDLAEGTIDNRVFQMKGNVTGTFPEYNAKLNSAESLKWTENGRQNGDGLIEARGNVYLTRGTTDFLKADYVLWEVGTDNYSARGRVDSRYEGRILQAEEASRTANTFTGIKVTRYEDIAQKTIMSADRVEGKTSAGVVREVVATGSVSVDYTDPEGFRTHLTGVTAVYSQTLDTIVVSGGAKAVRSDGKTVSSQTMILHVGTKNIEAIGNANITFIVGEKTNTDKGNDKKSEASN